MFSFPELCFGKIANWKEKFIDALPPIFAHKVKQELMGKNDSIDYDNLTYGDILSTIKKLGINMCNDEKLLKHQLKNKRKAKYEMGKFCKQYGLPPIAPSRKKSKKHDKNHKKYKKYRNNFVKPNDFYAKKKNVSKKYVKQRSGKGKNGLTEINLDTSVKTVRKNLVS